MVKMIIGDRIKTSFTNDIIKEKKTHNSSGRFKCHRNIKREIYACQIYSINK